MSEAAGQLHDLLVRHRGDPWDADETLGPEVSWQSPPGLLVDAILRTVPSPLDVLALLALFVAKRALACWELYCDQDGPIAAVQAAERALLGGESIPEEPWEESAEPSFRGVPIVDCRACDTGSAADAAARLVRFVRRRDPLDAVYCVSAAQIAFDQSPLGARDHFHRWLEEVALSAALERRSLSAEEAVAFREYSVQEVRDARGHRP